MKSIFYPEDVVLTDSVVRPRPLTIVQANLNHMALPMSASTALDFLTSPTTCIIVQDGADASSVAQIVRAYLLTTSTPYINMAARGASAELERHAVTVYANGGRNCMRPHGASSGFFQLQALFLNVYCSTVNYNTRRTHRTEGPGC